MKQIIFIMAMALSSALFSEVKPMKIGGFIVEHDVVLPGTPESVYDAVTGDISAWWDHTFSGEPAKFFIEARPGGRFLEIFNESGDGVQHATVIFAKRGEMLRFDGPLGFNGHALQMVHTYAFEAQGDSTRLTLSVHASGELQDGWDQAVNGVWRHFLFERLKPFLTGNLE